MKIQFLSDIHLEVQENYDFLKQHPVHVVGDILVVAGDITVLGNEVDAFREFAGWCSKNFKHTFIVPGNHEFYGGYDIAGTLDEWEMEVCPGVKFVNNKSVTVDDVEIFFTTLWASVPRDAEDIVNRYMPECSSAVLCNEPLRADKYTGLHNTCRQWLDNALAASTASRKVVVTHHCPVRAEDPRYESNGLSNAFVNPMEDYVARCNADAWIFGHTHYNGARNMTLGKTVLCTNQLGYAAKGICQGYADNCVIEV